jgi:hypothetical protein
LLAQPSIALRDDRGAGFLPIFGPQRLANISFTLARGCRGWMRFVEVIATAETYTIGSLFDALEKHYATELT